MSRIAVPKLDSKLLFRQLFTSTKEVADSNGVITSSPVIDHGASFDGTDDKITYPTVRGVKSVAFWIKLATTTEDIMELSSTQSIEAVVGTLTATGLSSPTFYVNGVATATIGTTRAHVVITTATAFNADSLDIGADDTYGEFTIEDVQFYSVSLTAEEAKDLYEKDTYAELNSPLIDLPLRSSYYKESGVELLTDGDMEAADVAAWAVYGGSMLTKETASPHSGTRCLRCTGTVVNAGARQTRLGSGLRYLVTGWARGDGTVSPRVLVGGGQVDWSGTSSKSWQPFSLDVVANGVHLYLLQSEAVAGYVEFDDVSVQSMETYTPNIGSLKGAAKLGDGTTTTTFPTQLSPHGYSFDGGNYVDTGRVDPVASLSQPFSFTCLMYDPSGLADLTNPSLIGTWDGAQAKGLLIYKYPNITTGFGLLIGSSAGKTLEARGAKCPVGLHAYTFTYSGSGTYAGIKIYIDGVLSSWINGSNGTIADAITTGKTLLLGARHSGASKGNYLTSGKKIYKPKFELRELTAMQVRKRHRDLLATLNV